jgi:hypothetical protein
MQATISATSLRAAPGTAFRASAQPRRAIIQAASSSGSQPAAAAATGPAASKRQLLGLGAAALALTVVPQRCALLTRSALSRGSVVPTLPS